MRMLAEEALGCIEEPKPDRDSWVGFIIRLDSKGKMELFSRRRQRRLWTEASDHAAAFKIHM